MATFFRFDLLSLGMNSSMYNIIIMRVFYSNVSWWFSTGVWMTASLLKSPRLFSVFWLILIWFSNCFLISKSSSPFTNFVGINPSAPITIGIIRHFNVPCFFFSVLYQGLCNYLSFGFLKFYSVVCRDGKVHNSASALFFSFSFYFSINLSFYLFIYLTISRSGRLTEIRWSVVISKSPRNLCISFSRTDSGLCIYHLFVWSNLNF